MWCERSRGEGERCALAWASRERGGDECVCGYVYRPLFHSPHTQGQRPPLDVRWNWTVNPCPTLGLLGG